MSMHHIRKYYRVPAKRGARVKFTWRSPGRLGTVVGSCDQYLRVRFDDSPKRVRFDDSPKRVRFDDSPKRVETVHATWELEFVGVTT